MGTAMSHLRVLDGWRGISILCVLAGHMIPLEAPEALSAAMLEFLGRSKMAHEA